jgi:hypothetical protein
MSVLSRELDSYQRAVDAYQRRMNTYNRGVDAYRKTLVRDANGNLLVVDGNGNVSAVEPSGRVIGPSLPANFNIQDYGATSIPDTSAFRQLRQGEPTESKRETLDKVYKYQDSETGEKYYYTQVDEGESGLRRERLTPDWRLEKEIPGRYIDYGDGGGYERPTYIFSRDASSYLEAPPEWTDEFRRKAPDPTQAQVRRASQPSLAQIETGLIGQVMRGGGVRGGVPVYRPRTS